MHSDAAPSTHSAGCLGIPSLCVLATGRGGCRGLAGAALARGAPAPAVPGRAPAGPPAPGVGFLLRRELKKLARTPSFSPGPPAPL